MTTIMDELTNTSSDLATLTKKQNYTYAMNEDIELLLSETTDINNTAQDLINYITYQDENNPAQLEIWEKNAIFFLQNVIDKNVSKDDNNIDNLSSYIRYVIRELYHLTRAALKIKMMPSIGTVVEPRVIEEMTDAEDSSKRRRQQGLMISLPDTSAPDTSAPDPSAPDPSVPDTSAPGTSAPDTSAPDPSAPDPSVPDTSAPGTSAPGTSAPDPSVPGTSASNIAQKRLLRSSQRMPNVNIVKGGMATRKKRKKKYRKHNKTKPKRYNKQIKHYTKKYRKHY